VSTKPLLIMVLPLIAVIININLVAFNFYHVIDKS
jgi:hypothetical protein